MLYRLLELFVRFIFSLRYKIEVKGLENLTPERLPRKGGLLFLPNHSAHLDPMILGIILWRRFRIRPMAVEYLFYNPSVKPLLKFCKAISVPNFETSVNPVKVRKAEEAVKEVSEGLKRGENFGIYPSGRLKNTAKEVVGGASGVHSLLQGCPEANPILVRTTGFWGSTFSRAIEGTVPEITKNMSHGLKVLLKNGIFFAPRRKIVVEFEPTPADFPWNAPKLEFNRYLEKWYNRYPEGNGNRVLEEPLKLVSFCAWKKEVPTPFNFGSKKQGLKGTAISSETRHAIYSEIRRIVDNPQIEIRDEMDLATDLGMDSLNVGDLMAFLSMKFDAEDLNPEDLDTVASALEIAQGARAKASVRAPVNHNGWPNEVGRPDPLPPMGETIPAAFLNCADRMGDFAACGDDIVGVMSYKKLKRSALVLAEYFKTLDGKYIGVLLPATLGAYLTILALQMAGKVPVMLNWTLGVRYLDEMIRLGKVDTVVSSWRFLDRVSNVDYGPAVDKLLMLENVKANLSLKMKLKGALLSMRNAETIMKGLNRDENATAVVLFTSGTEASPKGVPLSHKNVLSNIRDMILSIDLRASDIVYGFLPPFHSFGFTVTGTLSLVSGMRVAFYPDPTNSSALADGIDRWKVTLFCSAPTFLRGVLGVAKPEQLQSVRYFMVGAERTPQELEDKIHQLVPGARVVEGYGITECSPVLTMTRPNLPRKGIGHPFPDIEICLINPETKELIPKGAEGELCVRGPSIFKGYLGDLPSPFLELKGKMWYRTGDIVREEEDGTLILTGRFKRFAKIGGEMISLGALEDAISSDLIRRGVIGTDEPSIALIEDARNPGKAQLVLFATIDIDRDEVNRILAAAQFKGIMKVSNVIKVPQIPVMGTGKTHYRQLQSTLT